MEAFVIMELFCKFYLKTSLSRDALRAMFERDFASSPEYSCIDFFCRNNPYREGNDFISWPYHLEFAAIDEDNYPNEETFMYLAKKLYDELKKRNIEPVVACDFEEIFEQQAFLIHSKHSD